MNIEKFREAVASTWNMGPDSDMRKLNAAIGLSGEVGEVQEHVKKHLFHGKELDLILFLTECGDVLYYLQALIEEISPGTDLLMCMMLVDKKLKARHPRGFKGGYKS